MSYVNQITSADMHNVEEFIDTHLGSLGYGPTKTASVMRVIMEKKNKEDGISLADIDPTVFPLIKKAIVRYPTAKNDLEALVKLVQDEMKKEQDDINRLDKENDVQDDDIEGLDHELDREAQLVSSNRNLINNINARLDSLEKNQEEIVQSLQQTNEGYSFLREEPVEEVTSNNITRGDWTGNSITRNRWNDGDMEDSFGEKLGNITKDVEVWFDENRRIINLIWINPKPRGRKNYHAGEFELYTHGKYKGIPVYETHYSKLDRRFGGQGLGLKLYMFLLKEMGWILVSGDSHSDGAKKLWKRLVANPNTVAWTQQRYKNRTKKHEIYYDKDTDSLEGFVEPYPLWGDDEVDDHVRDEARVAWQKYLKQEKALHQQYNNEEITGEQFSKAMRKIEAEYESVERALNKKYSKDEEGRQESQEAQIYIMWNSRKKSFKEAYMAESKKKGKPGNYLLQLERDDDMYILHVKDTKTGYRTEIRGKANYETDGYDPNDPLHQVIDKIGKAANISDLMNGTVVALNPRHPDGPSSRAALKDLVGESEQLNEIYVTKYWIHPDQKKLIKLDTSKGLHHTADAFHNPAKYGVSMKKLGPDHEVDKYYDLDVAMIMYEAGWVRFSIEGEGYFTGNDNMQMAKAMKFIGSNNVEMNSAVIENETTGESIELNTKAEIRAFKRTGKKPQSRMNMFRESYVQVLNELFDKPLPYEVIQNRDMVFKAHFMTPDGKDVQLVAEQDAFTHDKHWEVVFDVDFENKVTGGGEEFLIFSTIIAILKEFVTSAKPINIYFSSFDNSASRTSLYGKMLQRFADKMGYEFTVDTPSGQSMKGDAEFYLSRKGINESEQLNELFNETYDYEWIDKTTNGEWTGEFTPDDGKVVGFYTSEGGSNENYMNEIIFDKGFINVGITGEGDAFKILSTIVKMAKEWVASTNPINFFFDASEPSRTKLYKAMANRFAKETGYSVEIDYVGKPSLGQRVRKQPNMSQGARFIFRKNAVNESKQQLTELFNDIYDYGSPRVKTSMKSEQEAYSVEYDFNTEEHEYTVQLLSWPQWGGGPDHWSVDFYIEGGGTAITNTGNAFKVLSTVVDIIKKTINDFTIEHLYFSAKEPSRRKLYAAMVKKLVKDMGWRHVDVGDDGYFVIKQGTE